MSDKVYNIITSRIMELLEKGTVPWRKTWRGADRPRSINNHAYRGINYFALSCLAGANGYENSVWSTFAEIKKRGGRIIKGERSWPVLFFRMVEKPDGTKYPLARYSNVWNIAQTTGIDLPKWATPVESANEFTPIEAAEALVGAMLDKPKMAHGVPCYVPSTDTVKMPKPEDFESGEEYYAALFHELAHSTGHASRLSRESLLKFTTFGDHSYSEEELVAEMTAAMLCGLAGIEQATIENQASYIAHWRKKLGTDPKLILTAAKQAQKAADLIANLAKPEVAARAA